MKTYVFAIKHEGNVCNRGAMMWNDLGVVGREQQTSPPTTARRLYSADSMHGKFIIPFDVRGYGQLTGRTMDEVDEETSNTHVALPSLIYHPEIRTQALEQRPIVVHTGSSSQLTRDM
jgi:hypothetical protein